MQSMAIGIDLGGTQLRAALLDQHGNLLARKETQTAATAGPDRVIDQMRDLTSSLLKDVDHQAIAGLGLSMPGPLDTEAGIALDVPTLAGFVDYPLRSELQKRFPFPISLENDGIAAAIGEWQFGAGRGIRNLLYLTVSTGIGGGAIIDGRVIRGRRGMAGHVGHMSLIPDGNLCPCGNRGCFEAHGSGTAFTQRAQLRAGESANTILGKGGVAIDSKSVFAAARQGDRLANSLIDEEAEILGRGLTSLIHIFSPELVIVGGGLSNEFARLSPGIRGYVSRSAMPAFRDVRIVQSALRENSGLVGAAALAFLCFDRDHTIEDRG